MQTTIKQGFTVTQLNDTYFISGKKKNIHVRASLDTTLNSFDISLLHGSVMFKASKNPLSCVKITLEMLLNKIDKYIDTEF
ncbi:hypothetical protein H1N69_gp44 [Lactococcus phage phiQ1]|uniref:Uncharacterized protein n=1 Tax=Lactococcus phage phiQ1 TaxID=2488571 RepID=A0A455VH66_9CAUD|nr:hypothetical protein H1N69_gp44 [Lactococcus phage phiQ1]BBI90346.1 putative uncharacterized protein [Lactococcus phage phiQ1]